MAHDHIKLVLFGDSFIGKTALAMSLDHVIHETRVEQLPNYGTTIGASRNVYQAEVDSHQVQLDLWDTAGNQRYNRLLPMFVRNADVALCCFSLVNRESLDEVRTRWNYIKQERPDLCLPLILVGTKLDLRNRRETIERLALAGDEPVQHYEGQELGQELMAFKYIECSALTQENVLQVFEEAIRVVQAFRHCQAHVIQFAKKKLAIKEPNQIKEEKNSICIAL